MEVSVRIEGDGIAACCCARLLSAAGAEVAVSRGLRPAIPAILLSQATQKLLRDIFAADDLFAEAHPIRKRIVAWGPGAQARELEHSAVILSEQVLLDRMWQCMGDLPDALSPAPNWTIFSSRPENVAAHRSFGSRMARFSQVQLQPASDPNACWIESVRDGWLFLMATKSRNGALITVGADCGELLAQSRLVRFQIDSRMTKEVEFPAYPRIAPTLCGDDWLSCGSAAMNFDPLCGEGAGNAVREAILAAAVVKAASNEYERSSLLQEYSTRLSAGFLRHLHLCREFYGQGTGGAFWTSALQPLEDGIPGLKQRLRAAPPFCYRLEDFDLKPAAHSAMSS